VIILKKIYNYDELLEELNKLDIYNKKIVDVFSYGKLDFFDKQYFVDLYNNLVVDGNIDKFKKSITIGDFDDDFQFSKSSIGLIMGIEFDDNTIFYLKHGNNPSELEIGVNSFDAGNLVEYEKTNIIFSDLIGNYITDIEVNKMSKDTTEYYYIDDKTITPFSGLWINLNNDRKIYYSWTSCVLHNSKTNDVEYIPYKEYKKCIEDIEQYFSLESVDRKSS